MKIVWNKVTWYSKLMAMILVIALPFVGFYFGRVYQKGLTVYNSQVANSSSYSSSSWASPLPTPIMKNPNPGALNVPEVIKNAAKYNNQKIKVSGRVDIRTGLTSVMCSSGATPCQQYEGSVYIADLNNRSQGEIKLVEKTRTDPSTYVDLGCRSSVSPIKTCANFVDGNLTELEGTFVTATGTTSGYMLII